MSQQPVISGSSLFMKTIASYSVETASAAGFMLSSIITCDDNMDNNTDDGGRTSTDIVSDSGNPEGSTISPGLYKSPGSTNLSSGNLTFDASENINAALQGKSSKETPWSLLPSEQIGKRL
jgi:hypothetical protein